MIECDCWETHCLMKYKLSAPNSEMNSFSPHIIPKTKVFKESLSNTLFKCPRFK